MKPKSGSWPDVFAGAFGSLLGLALLKFGNPVILDRLIDPPSEFWEYIFQPWPLRWGLLLVGLCFVMGAPCLRLPAVHQRWIAAVPLLWFAWQLISSSRSIEPSLTRPTLLHFGGCVLCFILGLSVLPQVKRWKLFWLPIVLAFFWVLWMGFEQHYGGLEATRNMFFQRPDWQQFPPEYIKKIQSHRIFSTLVYPNALAGAILLFLPAVLVWTWRMTAALRDLSRAVIVGVAGYASFACLFWSGSKSGWLIALVLIGIVLLRRPMSKTVRTAILCSVLALGLTAFFVKFAPYFRKGAPSVSARFEYWRAAARTALAHPLVGTGPGTFSAAYRKIKPPDAEMAQLVHNDYLEQASDGGVVSLVTYASFVLGSVWLLARRSQILLSAEHFAVWLGLTGWAIQSFVEFLLYIPALAWASFALIGWLWSIERGGQRDPGR